jgi:hypothetical protein
MTYRNFHLTESDKSEIINFDILYRINAQKHGEAGVLLNRANEWLEPKFGELFAQGLLVINERDHYALSASGKALLLDYGKMFQRFKDLSIFKCVYPQAPAPQHEGDPDERFGAYAEEAHPPQSEDYRVLIFENFCQREGLRPPLHLFVFFSLIENFRLLKGEEDWVWGLASGEIFTSLQSVIESHPNAESIAPEGWSANDIVDAIYTAGMAEMKRSFEHEPNKISLEQLQNDQKNFWVEETITENISDNRGYPQGVTYYDPYFDPRVSVGSALCVGAFAGLATCALLS